MYNHNYSFNKVFYVGGVIFDVGFIHLGSSNNLDKTTVFEIASIFEMGLGLSHTLEALCGVYN